MSLNPEIEKLADMTHSPVYDYVVPGVTSWLIGAPSPAGTVRMLTCSRDQQEAVTPHSHRFDFQCLVLAGMVRNRVWSKESDHSDSGDGYWLTTITATSGGMGSYECATEPERGRYSCTDANYGPGCWYGMDYRAIHSIWFSRGTKVLFFEGAQKSETSVILEPDSGGVRIPTFKTEPWMFRREA